MKTAQIVSRYTRAATEPSDIYEHVPTLRDLATQTPIILELGVGHARSTIAFLAGLWTLPAADQPHLYSMDINRLAEVDELEQLMQDTHVGFTYLDHNTRSDPGERVPAAVGGVFIDTWHVEAQVRDELAWAAPRVIPGGWLAFHDTTTFWEHGESDGLRGLRYGIEPWLRQQEGSWAVRRQDANNNGLLLLQRTSYVG